MFLIFNLLAKKKKYFTDMSNVILKKKQQKKKKKKHKKTHRNAEARTIKVNCLGPYITSNAVRATLGGITETELWFPNYLKFYLELTVTSQPDKDVASSLSEDKDEATFCKSNT